MITLTHLAIAAVLLITLGAFLVKRSAIERARSYRRGREEGLQSDVTHQSEFQHSNLDKPISAWEAAYRSGSAVSKHLSELEAESRAALARSLRDLGAIKQPMEPTPAPILQQPTLFPKEDLLRGARPDFPTKD